MGSAASTEPQFTIEKTSASHFTTITKEIKAMMKKSLKKDRWDGIELHEPSNYTDKNMVDRWTIEKNKWLDVSMIYLVNN